MKYQNNQAGYIALMSAIIISLVLMTLVTAVGFGGFQSRFNILDSEFKAESVALAESCVDLAQLKLVINPDYLGTETIVINADQTCLIRPIRTGDTANEKIIETQSIYHHADTNLRVVVDLSPNKIDSWAELPYY